MPAALPPQLQTLAGLLRRAWVEYERDRARYLAAAMIYYALVSLIPMLLLLLSGIGMLLRFSAFAAEAERQMLRQIQSQFGPPLADMLTGILDTLQQDSIAASVVSLAGLLWAASKFFGNLRLGFRAIWKYEPPLVSGPLRVVVRATIAEKAIALVMVLGGGVVLMSAFAVVAATEWLNHVLGSLSFGGQAMGWLLTGASSLLLATATFALLFKFLPPISIRWRDVWLAAILSAVAWVVASEFMTLYGMAVENNRSAYGVVGGFLVVLLWMNVISQVLFFGAEVSKVVATDAGIRAPRTAPVTSEPPRPLTGAPQSASSPRRASRRS